MYHVNLLAIVAIFMPIYRSKKKNMLGRKNATTLRKPINAKTKSKF